MRPSTYKFDEKTIRYYKSLKKLSRFLKHHIFLLAAALASVCLFYIPLSGWNGFYSDADGYMRALRIYHWLLNPSFFEQPIYESNYPFGTILNWTRPMDIIWLLVSLPFWLLRYPIKETLFISGAFISPLLGILCTIVLAYGLRRRFNIYLTLLGIIIFLANPQIVSPFSPGRPDHHALMILLATYSFSLIMCWLKKRQDRYMRLLGLTLALAVFTTIEGLLLYAIFIGFFLWLYIFKNISLAPAVKISKYFTLFLIVFCFLNPPHGGWFYPDTGRLSILYVTAAALSYLGLSLLQYSHLHTARLKILSLTCIILGFILSLLVIFDIDTLSPPFTKEIKHLFILNVTEMRSFHLTPISQNIATYLFPLVSVCLNLCLLKKHIYNRLLMLNLCFAVPVFCLTLYTIRFNAYSPLYCIIPVLTGIDYLYKKSASYKNRNAEFPSTVWLAILLIISIETLAPAAESIRLSKLPPKPKFSFRLCRQIEQIGGTLLTDFPRAPQYVWHCNVNTIGTPYHQNTQGIIDADKIFNAETDQEIIPQILKHQITQILIHGKYHKLTEKNKNKLYHKLIKQENIPPFLEKIQTFSSDVTLYEVKI